MLKADTTSVLKPSILLNYYLAKIKVSLIYYKFATLSQDSKQITPITVAVLYLVSHLLEKLGLGAGILIIFV